ncbi:MAG TPA: Ni/Fe-hydrogenase, b-type cytochrome subunit [Desulfobacterales bacterium]|nr:Ni/Fe-hydrogenase, b-type cytochrome subunit [Desulfobacterales bacterium]
MQYEKKYAWSWLLRLYHWAMVLSIVFLTFTGLYIDHPVTSSLTGGGTFPMADMRYLHFLAAFVFTGAVIARLYLALFGNRQENIFSLLRRLPENIVDAWRSLLNYLYISDYEHPGLGHNGLATIVYCFTFLLAMLQIFSGFYLLLPENLFWQGWGLSVFGSPQSARLIHYLSMWYFMTFAAVHVYIIVWNEIKHPEGMLSAMLGGYKFKPRKA